MMRKVVSTFSVAALAALPLNAQLTDTTWLGGTSSWTTGSNWSATAVPTEDNNAIFGDPTGKPQPLELSNRRRVGGITFNAGGWAIDVASTSPGTLQFSNPTTPTPSFLNFNSGTNLGTSEVFKIEVDNTVSGMTVDVAAGNTLVIHNSANSGGQITSKSGAGTLTFAAGGATDRFVESIAGGTVLANGAATFGAAGQSFEVASGGTLGGTGTMTFLNSNSMNLRSGGTLDPGASSAAAGTLSLVGVNLNAVRDLNVNFETGSSLAIDVFNDGTSDSLLVTNSSGVSESYLNIATGVSLELFGTPLYNTLYTIASITDRGEYDGSPFASVFLNDGLLTEGVDYNITYTAHTAGHAGSGGIGIAIIIPEPASAVLLVGGLGGLLAVRRRRLVARHG